MKQNHQSILLAIAMLGIVLLSGCTNTIDAEWNRLTDKPLVVNSKIGDLASPMDIALVIQQFSEGKTSEITVRISKREGVPARLVNWTNTNAEIILPDGLELIEGDLNWQGDIVGDDVKEFKIKVKAVKNGEWVIQATAQYIIDEDNSIGDGETAYILVKENQVLISDRMFTPTSPGGRAIQTNRTTTPAISFETILKGDGYAERKDYVINSEVEWTELWEKITSIHSSLPGLLPEVPPIDFSENTIIAVGQGSSGSTGYGIEITRIVERDDQVIVYVKETLPSPGRMYAEVITQPTHIVKIKKITKEIVFEHTVLPEPAIPSNFCEIDSDCKLIYSGCGCEAVPAADPRTSLEDPRICIWNPCYGTNATATCKANKCVVKMGSQ